MKRTDDFWSVVNEWAVGTRHKRANVRRMACAIAVYFNDKKEEATLGNVMKLSGTISRIRSVGKVSQSIYFDFLEWVQPRLEEDGTTKTTGAVELGQIDWEQRRYEIAKAVFVKRYLPDKPNEERWAVKEAVRMADLLIEELKK